MKYLISLRFTFRFGNLLCQLVVHLQFDGREYGLSGHLDLEDTTLLDKTRICLEFTGRS